jgi:Na+-translocating ferredoxin:NAD+ oxidoreductase RnfE subunit
LVEYIFGLEEKVFIILTASNRTVIIFRKTLIAQIQITVLVALIRALEQVSLLVCKLFSIDAFFSN